MNQMQVNRLELSENKQKISDNFVNSIVEELYAINFYPDTDYVRVKELIAHYNCVSAHNIFVGNGSDEIILSIMLGLGIVNTSIAVPRNSFMGYYFSGVLLNNKIAFVDLTNYSISAFWDLLWSECDADKVVITGEHTLPGKLEKHLVMMHECLDDLIASNKKYHFNAFSYEIID